MTIGDVLAVIGMFVGVGASWAAMLILIVLAFGSKISRAREALVHSPGRCFLRGFIILVLVGGLGITLSKLPGPIRILAFADAVLLGGLAAVGSGGLVRLLSDRIQETGSEMSPFATLTRSAILYVTAGFLPLFGWFLITPAALLASLGSGYTALWVQRYPSLPPTIDNPIPLAQSNGLEPLAQSNGLEPLL